jgi:hypothetical protein
MLPGPLPAGGEREIGSAYFADHARFEHCPPPYAMETRSFRILGMALLENSAGNLLFENPGVSPAAVREPGIRIGHGAGCSETL